MPGTPRSATLNLLIGGLLGLSPAIIVALDLLGDERHPWVTSLNSISAPVLVAELFAIIVATRKGLLGRSTWARIPLWCHLSVAGWLLVAWLGVALFAPEPVIAAMRTTIWMVHIIFGVALWRLAESGNVDPVMFAGAIFGGFAIYALLLAGYVANIDDPRNFNWLDGLPGMPHLRHFGYYAAGILGIGIGLTDLARTRRRWSAITVVMTVAFAMVCWSGTRGALFAVVAAFLFALVWLPALRRAGSVVSFGVAAVVGAGISLLLPVYYESMGLLRIVSASAPAADDISAGRWEFWRITLDLIKQKPLLGYGEGQLAFLAPPTWNYPQPHNLVLQLPLAWGIVGTACLAIPALVLAARLRGAVTRFEAVQPCAVAALTLLVYSAVDGTLFHVQPAAFFTGFVGVAAMSLSCLSPERGGGR